MNTKKNPFQLFIWITLCHGTGLDNTEIVLQKLQDQINPNEYRDLDRVWACCVYSCCFPIQNHKLLTRV